MTVNNSFSRRHFIKLSSVLAAGPIFSNASIAARETIDTESMIIINGLGGLSNPNLWVQSQQQDENADSAIIRMRTIDERAITDMHASGTTAINVTLGYVSGPEDPYKYTVQDIADWDSIIDKHNTDLVKIKSVDDIRNAKEEGKIGIIYGFQNASCIGNDLQRVSEFKNRGVRIIQLTYNDANQFGSGSVGNGG